MYCILVGTIGRIRGRTLPCGNQGGSDGLKNFTMLHTLSQTLQSAGAMTRVSFRALAIVSVQMSQSN